MKIEWLLIYKQAVCFSENDSRAFMRVFGRKFHVAFVLDIDKKRFMDPFPYQRYINP